eukprot:366238-Chlamydomonas_euryale.AAC.19
MEQFYACVTCSWHAQRMHGACTGDAQRMHATHVTMCMAHEKLYMLTAWYAHGTCVTTPVAHACASHGQRPYNKYILAYTAHAWLFVTQHPYVFGQNLHPGTWVAHNAGSDSGSALLPLAHDAWPRLKPQENHAVLRRVGLSLCRNERPKF